MAGPVHNGSNQLADSTNPGPNPPVNWGGLSPMGRDYVRCANELGIVLDGSHSSDAAIDQMIDLRDDRVRDPLTPSVLVIRARKQGS